MNWSLITAPLIALGEKAEEKGLETGFQKLHDFNITDYQTALAAAKTLAQHLGPHWDTPLGRAVMQGLSDAVAASEKTYPAPIADPAP